MFDPNAPLANAHTLPASAYRDAQLFERERDAIFANSWQCVGRSEQVVNVGAFITAEIASEPIAVVRGDDGVLRGFHNVCRHRAFTVLAEPEGCVSKLRCRYHGWTYDLAGQLRGTPEFDGVCEFRKDDNGLVPVAVQEWGGFVWVSVCEPKKKLEQYLDPMPAWAQRHQPLDGLQWYARREYTVFCNWKVYIDNYLDGGYHVNTVHPDLAGVLDYSEYRTTTHGNTALQTSPLVPGEGDAGRTRTGTAAYYWWAWPNFMLNAYSGVVDTNLVLPVAVDCCKVVFDFYFPPNTAAELVQASLAVADRVQAEDAEVCERVQRGLGSRSYSTGRFSVKRENAGYYFHQKVWQAMNA
jgi:choline monooxygenase